MNWRRRDEISNEQVMEVAQQLNINPLLTRILLNRNMSTNDIRIIMKDTSDGILDPRLLTNAEQAAELIAKYCINPNAEIWVFADYDADGITSGYIMTSALREVAACPVDVYYPERIEGYGLGLDFCKKLVGSKDQSRDTLVITVDNGISCVDEIAFLKANGIEVVVTDHHVAKEIVPDCIIVDPHNHNEPDTYKHLAGCGVAFKVAQIVHWILDAEEAPKMFKYFAPVAIGTLADCMPMNVENITLIGYGLGIINSNDCSQGIKALKDFLGKQTINANEIAWDIAPRINACGRMGDVYLASKLFFGLDFGENYQTIINNIEKLNAERKDYTKKAKVLVSKLNLRDETVCVVDASSYPKGIIGNIANMVIEQYNRPAIVFSNEDDTMVGSARSINGINLQELLKAEYDKGNIVEYGGHEVAAGLTIKKDKLEELKHNLSQSVKEILDAMPQTDNEEQELIIDELIEPGYLNEATYELINSIPYDDKPIFALTDMEVLKYDTSNANKDNIWFNLKDENGNTINKLWAWGMTDAYKLLGNPKKIHLAGTIERDFTHPNKFTLKVIDIIKAE